MRYRIPILILLVLVLVTGLLFYSNRPQAQPEFGASVAAALSDNSDTSGFARATGVRQFTFPADAGPHPEFQTEWWYYTGNLDDASGRHFGFQLTFFRRAMTPYPPQRSSDWATDQIYFAHFTVSDIANQAFYPSERFSRGAAGLAGAQADPFRVWLENWSASAANTSSNNNSTNQPNTNNNIVRLYAGNDSATIDLNVTPSKPVALQGDHGLSQKSADPGNASYYYSETRLDTTGNITIRGQTYHVQGLSWLDREWSTSALSSEESGWDWFSLQLSDGRDLMLYQLRLKNGGIAPHSSGSVIDRDGTVHTLSVNDFKIDVLDHWKSPHTGAVYPSRWHVTIPAYNIALDITPYEPDQELPLTFAYWEGAVRISGQNISGSGYVELTSYTRPGEGGLGSRTTSEQK